MIHFFIGTKAQYIKTAPLLRLMAERRARYRLIDSGQHADFIKILAPRLGIGEPDFTLATKGDLRSVAMVASWLARSALMTAFRPAYLRAKVFGGEGGLCVIHGDTPSTLVAALMARRAGLLIAHLEAGLRSHNLLRPFPEELIRLLTMKMADLLFAPSAEAVANLGSLDVRGEIVFTRGNTSFEALDYSLNRAVSPGPTRRYAVAALHRVENVMSGAILGRFVDIIALVARHMDVVFVMHPPTALRLERAGLLGRIRAIDGIEVRSLLPHDEFVRLISRAEVVLADGGSIQEECSYLGVPNIILRRESERSDGLGENAILGGFDAGRIEAALVNREGLRRRPKQPSDSPSEIIFERIINYL